MYYKNIDVVYQEVPNEVSLCLSFSGCPIRCVGCHSPELWSYKNSTKLTTDVLDSVINKYDGLISCVLFMGGDWEEDCIDMFQYIKDNYPSLKLCLYSGYDLIDQKYYHILDYIKLGAYQQELGGLNSSTTNQKFITIQK